MSDAKSLVALGKTAVENALSNLELYEKAALAKVSAERKKIADELTAYKNAHAAEVQVAEDLLAKAGTVAVQAAEAAVEHLVPAKYLSTVKADESKLGAWIKKVYNEIGWKGVCLIGAGLLLVHYLHKTGHI